MPEFFARAYSSLSGVCCTIGTAFATLEIVMAEIEFSRQLDRQLRFIETSCCEFDAGNRDEAIRIASALSIIFHDTSDSTSVLRQTNRKNILILSTCLKYPKEWHFWPVPNLTRLYLDPVNQRFECQPNLFRGLPGRSLPAVNWWTEVVNRRGREKMRRADVIQAARNTDGGGHVALELSGSYREMAAGLGWEVNLRPESSPAVDLKLQDVHLATLRQFGYEVLKSPELLALAGR
jgi:hypothetical protein